ncbi:MAG: PD-(D/E)XK nuclease family transposase [Verrucomicrobia bacterium]|nr:PD-(D/E)XK nuclease family transposase [Cytophagales bacterium]
MKAKYINPFTDFGFKKIFGEEVNKDLLTDFLNQILPEKHQIKDLFYKKSENLGSGETDRKAIFDIYCESQNGDKFIVEMQKAKQNFFKDRTVFYSTFPIREQAEQGECLPAGQAGDFQLKAVYCVAILPACRTGRDFVFDDASPNPKFVHTIQLKDDNHRVFYDKLTFIFLEMPKFKKSESELETHFDKWLYFLKNLEKLEAIPAKLRDRIFEKAFTIAEIAKFIPEQMEAYENSLKYYRDLKNVIDSAVQEAVQKTTQEIRTETQIEIVKNAIAKGLPDELIAELTGLPIEQIQQIRENN